MSEIGFSSRRKAVLLEPHPFCHSAIAALLGRSEIEVVGAATTACTAVTLLQEHRPQLLVTELELPEGREEALAVIARGRHDDPSLTIIVLSSIDETPLIDAAFERGASAYVLKTAEPEAIATAIRQAFEPSVYFAPRPERDRQGVAPPRELLPKLTRRELEILRLVSEGRSNRQVAELLWVTDQTVKFHLANVYRKLGVRSRFDAARWALEHGVLEVAESGEVVALAAVSRNGNASGNGNGHTHGTLVQLRRPVRKPGGTTERREGTSR